MRRSEKSKQICIYVTAAQYAEIANARAGTTCRSVSEYARRLLLGKPITVYYRNRSFDEFSEHYLRFKEEIKSLLAKDVFTLQDRQQILQYLSEIKKVVNSIADKCMLR